LATQVPGHSLLTNTDTSSTTPPASGTLTSVEAHLADILATVTTLAPTRLGLGEAEGLVLAEDVTATHPLPSFDNSAMDGYAVHAEDVASASEGNPVTLPVVGEIAAGDTGAYALAQGSSIRIMTGAMLPNGAELVIPVEWTDGGTARVIINAKGEAGHAIRLAGGDAAAGEVLVTSGTRLKPMHIAAIAAAGHGSVMVRPRPRVVVLSTGNELAEPGAPIVPGRIWDSNSFMIAAAAREAGCLAYRQAGISDNADEVLQTIEDQLVRADLLVTTGGVSMGGEHDVVKSALQELGTMTFRKIAMQPGMPQGFGTIGEENIPIITLPGNPVSAYVSFQLFVRPALGALQGDGELGLPTVKAELTEPLRSPPGRRSYLRARLDRHGLEGGRVTPLTGQGSHQIATLGRANALITVPEWVVQMQAGELVDVLVLP
jgi:molybdopterin molybdotransferase